MTTASPFWSNPGVWVAIGGGLLMAVNAVRAMVSPATFAVYFGLPLADARDAAFVRVYGLRALFVALTMAILVIRQEPHLLGSVALAAVVMSAGDAWLTARAQADRRTIARHILISVALVAAGSLLLIA